MSGRTTTTFYKRKYCLVQFSLYRERKHPGGGFRQKEINFKPQRQLSEKSIAVSTVDDSINSVK